MKTCGDCEHYYLPRTLCEARLPQCVQNADPMSNYSGDEVRTVPPDTNAERCRVYRKRRARKQD